jgi:hypothetical protein
VQVHLLEVSNRISVLHRSYIELCNEAAMQLERQEVAYGAPVQARRMIIGYLDRVIVALAGWLEDEDVVPKLMEAIRIEVWTGTRVHAHAAVHRSKHMRALKNVQVHAAAMAMYLLLQSWLPNRV